MTAPSGRPLQPPFVLEHMGSTIRTFGGTEDLDDLLAGLVLSKPQIDLVVWRGGRVMAVVQVGSDGSVAITRFDF
jgi:hypothetical protein